MARFNIFCHMGSGRKFLPGIQPSFKILVGTMVCVQALSAWSVSISLVEDDSRESMCNVRPEMHSFSPQTSVGRLPPHGAIGEYRND